MTETRYNSKPLLDAIEGANYTELGDTPLTSRAFINPARTKTVIMTVHNLIAGPQLEVAVYRLRTPKSKTIVSQLMGERMVNPDPTTVYNRISLD